MTSLSMLVTLVASLSTLLPHSGGVVAAPADPAKSSCWRNTTCTGPRQASFPGAWEVNNFSPASRTVSPVSILQPDGSYLTDYPIEVELAGNGSLFVFDFGKEVGGIVTVTYSATGAGNLGLAFSEAKNWTGRFSDDSNGAVDSKNHADGALSVCINTTDETSYTMPDARMRGGFRYLTLFSDGDVKIEVLDITCEISFAPAWSNLRAYGGYFDSSDPLLNKIWYSGAYTLQTNAIPPSSGRAFPIIGSGWMNDAELNIGTTDATIYVDGSKRDRTVWAGDLAIAVPSILVSTGDAEGVKNTLQVLLNDQASSGALPFAGPAIDIYNSDTYHMATMIGIYEYYLFTKDDEFLTENWDKFKLALTFITDKIDDSGLLYVTGTSDWGRMDQGEHNTEANMIMYKTLRTSSSLAAWMDDSALASNLSTLAAKLKDIVNINCWDASAGAFGDSEGDNSIHPQDGNSMALVFGAANTTSIQNISLALTANWITIGSLAPELPNNLIGFGQSFEIKAHLAARQATRALDLIRRAWGWYLNHPSGTASTCIEGYLADGTFGYRDTTGYGNDYSYTSHAHGWSTGPTDALTSYVVGIQLTAPAGDTWVFAPQFGDLESAQGGFTTPLGKFSAGWISYQGGYTVWWRFPTGTLGTLVLPGLGKALPSVEGANGERIFGGLWNSGNETLVVDGMMAVGSLKVWY